MRVKISRDLVVTVEEVLNFGEATDTCSKIIEFAIKITICNIPAELGALELGVTAVGHNIFPTHTNLVTL